MLTYYSNSISGSCFTVPNTLMVLIKEIWTTLGQSKSRWHAATHCLINLELMGYSYLKY